MIKPTEQERKVFSLLAQGGEGEIIANYLERVRIDLLAELVDKEATEADIAGAKLNRKLCLALQEALVNRGIITPTPESLS